MKLWTESVCVVCLFWAGLSLATHAAEEESYELAFSTYVGGKCWEHARDICTDNDGNFYVVGGTSSHDFPTTPGAYDRTFHADGKQIGAAGLCDAFVLKFSTDGALIWSTLLGGPNYDRAYAVEVDGKGNVYVSGRAGPGFPTSDDAFQPEYGGSHYNGFYGSQNGFVAKFSPDGDKLIWASYVGVGELCRDLDIDADGDIYLPMGWNTRSESVPAPKWMASGLENAFQKKPAGGIDCGVVKVTSDGSAVVWATWLGGSGKDTQEASIRVDAKKRVAIVLNTQSRDMPTTEGAFSQHPLGSGDGYVAMLKDDGSALVYGTYVGGQGQDWAISTHNLALDAESNAYVAMGTASADFPVTPGTFGRRLAGPNDIGIVKLSPRGALVCSARIGGNGQDGADGIYVDSDGNVYFAGTTNSTDFPTTPDAFQVAHGGDRDAVVVLLSADFSRLLYSTYMGGKAFDTGRSACLGPRGDLCLTGAANGPGWPVRNAVQATFAGTNDGRWGNGDCIVARFRRTTR